MQKVICVKPFTDTQQGMENAPRPEVGDVDVVSNVFKGYGYTYYILERFAEDNGYRVDHFATIPDATAEEMQEEEDFIYEPLSC